MSSSDYLFLRKLFAEIPRLISILDQALINFEKKYPIDDDELPF